MKKTRSNRLEWQVLIAILVALTGWNVYQNLMLKKRVVGLERDVEGAQTSAEAKLHAMMDAQRFAIEQQGRQLKWPQMEQLLGDSEAPETHAGYGLVLYISELACNACRDIETQFASSIAQMTGGAAVRIVVHSANPRWALNYARDNGTEVPVFFDSENRFGEANGVDRSPMLFLHDDQGEVVSAHFALPDPLEWSEPFHDRCFELFGLLS